MPRPSYRHRRQPAIITIVLLSMMPACTVGQVTEDLAVTAEAHQSNGPTPTERQMALVTTGCGHASGGVGSGVLLTDGLVLTAGHVVAGAKEVWVTESGSLPPTRGWPEFSADRLKDHPAMQQGRVRLIDTRRDLAIVGFGPKTEQAIDGDFGISTIDLRGGEDVIVFGVADPGPGSGTVVQRARIVTSEVRGTGQIERLGNVLAARTLIGDSGAGVWYNEHLAGVIFAVSAGDADQSWAVAGSEIDGLLTSWREAPVGGDYQCVSEESRMQPTSPMNGTAIETADHDG